MRSKSHTYLAMQMHTSDPLGYRIRHLGYPMFEPFEVYLPTAVATATLHIH